MRHDLRMEYIKFSLVEALFFAIFSITSYQTVFLQEAGLDSSEIGLIVSVSSVVGLIAVPVWGIISDRLHTARKTFFVSVAITSVMYGILPVVGSFADSGGAVFYIYIPLIFLFKQASNSMLDSWCISELSPKGISYGSVRMWGSVGYSLISIALGFLIGVYYDVSIAFYLIIPLIALLLMISPQKEGITGKNEEVSRDTGKNNNYFRALFKNHTFLAYIIYAFGLNIYLAVTLIFMTYILLEANCQTGQVGLVTGIRALIEISTMYFGSRCVKKIPIRYIMIVPGILFGLEHLLYQYAANIYGILAIMVLSGAAGGIFYSLGPSYIYEIVPEEVRNTAQACNAMNMTIVSIVGSLIGGYVINIWGIHTLTTSCGILIFVLTLLFIISLKLKHSGLFNFLNRSSKN